MLWKVYFLKNCELNSIFRLLKRWSINVRIHKRGIKKAWQLSLTYIFILPSLCLPLVIVPRYMYIHFRHVINTTMIPPSGPSFPWFARTVTRTGTGWNVWKRFPIRLVIVLLIKSVHGCITLRAESDRRGCEIWRRACGVIVCRVCRASQSGGRAGRPIRERDESMASAHVR